MRREFNLSLCMVLLSNAPSHTAGSAVPPFAAQAVADSDASDGEGKSQQGFASYYAREFDGRKTASGRRFDNDDMLAAHPTLPFGTVVRVTNLMNDQSVEVEIVDRGPARGPRAKGVIIDLSRAAAEALDFVKAGRTRVRLTTIP